MLQFYSASLRIVNTKRGVHECIESALGSLGNSANLFIYNASIGHRFQDILDETKRLYPLADVVATSCAGVVGKEGVSESMKDMALMAITGDDYAIAHTDGVFGHNTYAKIFAMAQSLKAKRPNINMVYFVSSGIDINNSDSLQAFHDVFGADITVFGATSSDNMKGAVNYQAVNDTVYEHGAFAIAFADPTLQVETKATHGFTGIDDSFVVTKSSGHIIHELNHKPAWPEYLRYLGLPESATCSDTLPIGGLGETLSPAAATAYGNALILRTVSKHDGNDMYYATTCPEGTKLWLTVRDESLIFSEMECMVSQLVTKVQDRSVVAVFHADCLTRGRFLFNRVIKDELIASMQTPFYSKGQCPPWLGMYGFGEFARLDQKNMYHNYTTALSVLTRAKH